MSFASVSDAITSLKVAGSRKGVSRSAIKAKLGDSVTVARVNVALKKAVAAGKLIQIGDSFKVRNTPRPSTPTGPQTHRIHACPGPSCAPRWTRRNLQRTGTSARFHPGCPWGRRTQRLAGKGRKKPSPPQLLPEPGHSAVHGHAPPGLDLREAAHPR